MKSSSCPAAPTAAATLTNRLADWRAYAAAGAASLAAASSADASIIYGTINVEAAIPANATADQLVSIRKTFTIAGARESVSAVQRRSVPVRFAAAELYGKAQIFESGSFGSSDPEVRNFAKGGNISGGNGHGGALKFVDETSGAFGNFAFSRIGYVGFILPASKGGYTGWMRVEVLDRNHDGFPDAVEAIDYAYNTGSGGITAGQVPEPSALGLLALGSTGVLAWRKRRQSA